jgi:hypothetical protein
MLSTLLSTLYFAALAAATLTTSMWRPYVTFRQWPSTYSETLGFYASVVNVNNDRTTLAGRFDDNTNPSQTLRDLKDLTITVGPSYYNVISPAAGSINLTWSGECTSSSQGAAIVCTEIVNGPGAFPSICNRSSGAIGDPPMTTKSFQFISGLPQFCFTDTTVPIEYLAKTSTVGQSSMTTFSMKVLVTAGEEKLRATTGATGGVGPMKTSAPLLAGLGAAMAVFV